MNGTHLIRNLHWLGKTNQLLSMEEDMVDEKDGEGDSDDEMTYPLKKFSGHGLYKKKQPPIMSDRELRKALPKMANTLGNWTLHGQNLGAMLRNY